MAKRKYKSRVKSTKITKYNNGGRTPIPLETIESKSYNGDIQSTSGFTVMDDMAGPVKGVNTGNEQYGESGKGGLDASGYAAIGSGIMSGLSSPTPGYNINNATKGTETSGGTALRNTSDQITQGVDGGLSAIPGYGQIYGAVRGIGKPIQDAITEEVVIDGKPTKVGKNIGSEALNQAIKPQHEHMIENFTSLGDKNKSTKAKVLDTIGSVTGLSGLINPIRALTGEYNNAANEAKATAENQERKEQNNNTANRYLSSIGEQQLYANGGNTNEGTSELTKFFGPSHAQGGINIGGGKEVEGGETMKDGFVHSDRIGYDKKGNPTFDEKNTKVTFADKAKKIDKLFIGRTDAISKKTKEMMYAKVENDNRKVGPIADAMNGNPSEEGKFYYGADGNWVDDGTPEPGSNQKNRNFNNRADGIANAFGITSGDNIYAEGTSYKEPVMPKMQSSKDFTGQDLINAEKVGSNVKAKSYLDGEEQEVNEPTFALNSTTGKYEPVSKPVFNTANNSKIGFTPGDMVGMGSNLPSIGRNMYLGMKKPEEESLRLNPNDPKVKQLMADRRINFQTLQNEITKERTKGAQDIGNNTRSVGSRNANLQNLYANSQAAKANMKLKEQQANVGYRGEEASMLNNLGQQEAAERIRQQTVNSQNKAFATNAMTDAFSGMSKQLATNSKIMNANSANNVTVESVNALSQKYQVDKRVINNLINQGKSLAEAEEMVKWYKNMA